MAREKFQDISCAFCGKTFEIATEDIEWEHTNDAGESETAPGENDYGVFQKIGCPKCGKKNSILVKWIGTDEIHRHSIEIINFDELTKFVNSTNNDPNTIHHKGTAAE